MEPTIAEQEAIRDFCYEIALILRRINGKTTTTESGSTNDRKTPEPKELAE
jgi:hypothetical protein